MKLYISTILLLSAVFAQTIFARTTSGIDEASSEDRFELPGFDKTFPQNSNGVIDEKFKTDEYAVHYQRSSSGIIDINWEKGTDKVSFNLDSTGAVNQEWHFGDVAIYLARDSKGASYQTWKFGETEYNLQKTPTEPPTEKWTNDNEDSDSLEKYQNLISQWCLANQFLVPERKCAIYKPVQPSIQSSSQPSDEISPEDRFTLQGFDKSFLNNGNGVMDESFKTDEYTVRYQRSSSGIIDINWEKGTDKVSFDLDSTGAVNQEWHFGDVAIYLARDSKGASYQTWKFGETEYNLQKTPTEPPTEKWTNDNEDSDSLERYQNLISQWCLANQFLVPERKCAIYKPVQPSIQSSSQPSDEISPEDRFTLQGFDKSFLNNGNDVMDETFKTDEYTVRYQRSSSGIIDINWEKGTDKVSFNLDSTGAVNQEWHFGDVAVYLARDPKGTLYQTWKFGETEYNVEKTPSGDGTETWTDDNEDLDNLEKYKDLISEWCAHNEFLLPQNTCIIYNYSY